MRKTGLLQCALMVTGAACSGDGGSAPSPTITDMFLSVETSETEAGRQVMLVDEVGSAHVIAFRNSIGADPGRVFFTSSSPAVLMVQATGSVDASLVAVAPGSAQILARAQGLTDQIRVDVVESPLPVDPIHVRLAPVSSEVESVSDAGGNLISIRLAVGQSAALDVVVTRHGSAVTKIPFLLTASEPATIRVDQHCRPPELDPQCSVFGSWGWVTGLQPGPSQVTVTVRNESASFLVDVLGP